MASIIQIRRDTASNWSSANPTLAQGELGLETDTLKVKAGDGSTAWNSASYLIDTGGYITATYSGNVAITGSLAGDNIKLDGNAISSTNTDGNIQLFPNGTGYTELYGNTNAGAIRFNCESNSHGVTLKGPPHSAAATYSLELPNADGSAGQLLKTDGSGKLAFTSSLPGVTATAAELNILDGVTATAAEINILDGVTATTAEINYLDITTLGTSQASKAVTADANGVVTFDNGLSEEYTAVTSSSNATAVNLRDGTNFSHTLTENTTFTFSNPAASGKFSAFTLKLVQDGSASGYTVTWPGAVDWPAATAPTLTATANAVDYFVFITHDGGTTYYGFTAGQALA
jgi:hypothetical protein